MKVLISSKDKDGLDSCVSQHIEHCPYYILIDLEDDQILSVKELDNPYFIDHQTGMVPIYVLCQGVHAILTGRMERFLIRFFEEHGIDVACGASGTVRTTLESYLTGDLHGTASC